MASKKAAVVGVVQQMVDALRVAKRSLEWNVQWLGGEDKAAVEKDIEVVDAAIDAAEGTAC
jgi:hypothetical protein